MDTVVGWLELPEAQRPRIFSTGGVLWICEDGVHAALEGSPQAAFDAWQAGRGTPMQGPNYTIGFGG